MKESGKAESNKKIYILPHICDKSDNYCKGFSTWEQFVTMCYAQIANHNGQRSFIGSLNTSGHCRYHLGIHKDLARSIFKRLTEKFYSICRF